MNNKFLDSRLGNAVASLFPNITGQNVRQLERLKALGEKFLPTPTVKSDALRKLRLLNSFASNAGDDLSKLTPDMFSTYLDDMLRTATHERDSLRKTVRSIPAYLDDTLRVAVREGNSLRKAVRSLPATARTAGQIGYMAARQDE